VSVVYLSIGLVGFEVALGEKSVLFGALDPFNRWTPNPATTPNCCQEELRSGARLVDSTTRVLPGTALPTRRKSHGGFVSTLRRS
jgi:hypothetical protein